MTFNTKVRFIHTICFCSLLILFSCEYPKYGKTTHVRTIIEPVSQEIQIVLDPRVYIDRGFMISLPPGNYKEIALFEVAGDSENDTQIGDPVLRLENNELIIQRNKRVQILPPSPVVADRVQERFYLVIENEQGDKSQIYLSFKPISEEIK